MKNKLSASIFIMLTLIFLLSQPSLGLELGTCSDCHGKVIPIPSNSLTKECTACHGEHDDITPATRVPKDVHNIHSYLRKKSDRKDCKECHRNGPANCAECHNTHGNTGILRTTTRIVNMSNMSSCVDCHGPLPQPGGHVNFRDVLSNSKHKWMDCRTCHINVYKGTDNVNSGTNSYSGSYEFDLHFKDLSTIPISDSVNLCKICHSPQYNGLKDGSHGEIGKTCINCHNPHTTKFGAMVKIPPKEVPSNISTRVESATGWITENVPIFRNTTAIYVIIIIILSVIAEHILSKDEEGKKTAYDTVKIHDSEETLKTLELKLKNQNIDAINKILRESGVNIMGMTMTKEEEYGDIITYKYVIFMNIGKSMDESVLTDKIVTMDDVKSAIFTDRYEL